VSLSGQIEAVNSGLEKAFEQRENHHHDQFMRYLTEDQRHCHQAFKTSAYEMFKNINPDRVEGTCEWVLKSPEYLRWWNTTSNDLLWISADPGCGKSVLARSLIDEVFASSDPNVSIVYFFFKDNDEQNNLATALCAVLHQLFTLQPQLLQHALPFWERNREKLQHEIEDLWRILMAATSDPACGNTICVFDALDECRDQYPRQDQKQLIEKLREFHDQRPASRRNWLKFLVTSRPYDDIQDHFRPVTDCFPQIHLRGEEENDQIHEEINLVVKVSVAELGQNLGLETGTQQRLEKELCEMKHRTYLWLYLAIDDIKRTLKNSLRPDREPIPPLPKNVPEAFERILDRAPSDQRAKVETILRIIVGARRPLTIREMAMALGVATTPDADTAKEACLSPKGLDKKIRQLCGLFVFIKESKIYLIHQTAREFLISNHDKSASLRWHLEPSKTEVQMAEICVKYLLMDDLVSDDGVSVRSLLDYSAENWADHFRDISCPETELVQRVRKLYDVTTHLFRLWFPKFWETAMAHEVDPGMEALHLAAFNGHQHILCRVPMSEKGAIDRTDRSGTNALQWATVRGYFGVVQQLLEMGANVNARGGEYGYALVAAAGRGHLEIVQLLLEAGADANTQGGYYGNALQAAAANGYLEIVQLLLKNGADVNAQGDEEFGNALYAAAARGHLDIVQLLVENKANVNAQGGRHSYALPAAAARGHLEIVHLLLETGADVNAQGGYEFSNSLHAAAHRGHLDVVQVLLENGANVDAQGGICGNALQAAALQGYPEIVQSLLENGANVNAQGGEYGNALVAALVAATAGERLEVVRVLLDNGANANAQGGEYGNALSIAAVTGYLEIVQKLLKNGANANAQGGYYGNALQAAAFRGHLEIVQLLLENGANVNARGGEYGYALVAAAVRGHLGIVKLLLEAGADANPQGGEYGNALQAAAAGGHLEIVQLLLKNGADVNAQGGYYGNALQAAAAEGDLEIVQLLLENGADINTHGGYYGYVADHTSTLDTVNNLGNHYYSQGKLKDAEEMYQRALAGYEKALGPDHTSTLDTVSNLGNLYYSQGKLKEAEEMHQRALAGYEKGLGPYNTGVRRLAESLNAMTITDVK
jgi:ankyrin repeat protein